MANEITNALKSAADTVARYVDNVATMTVETRYVELGDDPVNFQMAKPAARTEIRLDGDCAAILPVYKNSEGVMVVNSDMFETHQRNVATAIEYRARMMDALLQTLKQAVP